MNIMLGLAERVIIPPRVAFLKWQLDSPASIRGRVFLLSRNILRNVFVCTTYAHSVIRILFRCSLSIMTYSSGPHGPPPFSTSFIEEQATLERGRSPTVSGVPSRAPSSTQYAFIVQTGDESSTTMKGKLKTVRSHVMKNYLHQQQQRQNSKSSSRSRNSTERRKGKTCARRSRSTSFDVATNPSNSVNSELAQSTAALESLAPRFSLLNAFFDWDIGQFESSGKFQLCHHLGGQSWGFARNGHFAEPLGAIVGG